jgi:hypothetical protein
MAIAEPGGYRVEIGVGTRWDLQQSKVEKMAFLACENKTVSAAGVSPAPMSELDVMQQVSLLTRQLRCDLSAR